jgi:hypothetical protein
MTKWQAMVGMLIPVQLEVMHSTDDNGCVGCCAKGGGMVGMLIPVQLEVQQFSAN